MATTTPAQIKAAMKKLAETKSVQTYIKLEEALASLETASDAMEKAEKQTLKFQSYLAIAKRLDWAVDYVKKNKKAMTTEFLNGYASREDLTLKRTTPLHYYVIDNRNDEGADDSVSEFEPIIIGAVYNSPIGWLAFMGTVKEPNGPYKSKWDAAKTVFGQFRG
jgi:hypothetical protein